MKTCEHFEYPVKVAVTFDDMVGMECPLCEFKNRNEELLDRIGDGRVKVKSHESRILKSEALEWLEQFSKDIEEGRI